MTDVSRTSRACPHRTERHRSFTEASLSLRSIALGRGYPRAHQLNTDHKKVPIMKFLIKAAVIAAALGGSAVASAATYDFSYTFTDGQQITGSLDGTLSGTSITNISDLQVSLNGIAFTGGSAA